MNVIIVYHVNLIRYPNSIPNGSVRVEPVPVPQDPSLPYTPTGPVQEVGIDLIIGHQPLSMAAQNYVDLLKRLIVSPRHKAKDKDRWRKEIVAINTRGW